MLIKAGVDVNAKNKLGQTVLQAAHARGEYLGDDVWAVLREREKQ